MSEFKPLDPTACGLFLVAAISFPLALGCLTEEHGAPAELFMLLGALIGLVALLAYRAESNFGFTVFLLVGAAVFATGYGLGGWGNIGFAVLFLMTIIWSLIVKTPKLLTAILCTTTLIFLLVGLGAVADLDLNMALGIVALLNGIFCLYLGFGLVSEGKVKVF
ncbi:MAG: hypothetical protein IKQ93_01500 [Candidatus Methanomethylophilaceae archaeon]|nr:hypothetical protein [Candidatus Methanomethylophilaceae archaeon]MBR6911918.1 hypothetical protein [Candidatus Methanomethylophilaceae archaeon]